MNLVRWSKVLGTAALLIVATQTILAAQKIANTGPKYDVANEVKIKGVVEDIREVPGNFEGTHLVVKTDTGTVLVHVAPADFLKEMDTSFKKGDEVTVTGAKAPDAAEPEILAREITVGTNTTTLRDDKGIPVWAGWKPAKSN
jgi:DNA/RNA endonuclease YhcR with UshA esterase domain